MPVQIHINGENAEETIRELSVLASHLSLSVAAAQVAASSAPEATKAAEKTTRSRSAAKAEPVKETVSEPIDETVSTPVEPDPVSETTPEEEEAADQSRSDEAVSTDPIPTVVELRAKAQEVGTTPDAKKAIKALLDEFGSKSISDVSEDKRAAFLKRLEELA